MAKNKPTNSKPEPEEWTIGRGGGGDKIPAQEAQKRWQGWQSWPLKYCPSSQVMEHRDPCRLKTETQMLWSRQRGHDSPAPYATNTAPPGDPWFGKASKQGTSSRTPFFPSRCLFCFPVPIMMSVLCCKLRGPFSSLSDWLAHPLFTPHLTPPGVLKSILLTKLLT